MFLTCGMDRDNKSFLHKIVFACFTIVLEVLPSIIFETIINITPSTNTYLSREGEISCQADDSYSHIALFECIGEEEFISIREGSSFRYSFFGVKSQDLEFTLAFGIELFQDLCLNVF
jgi:hypothetical protein